jgi:D-amino-acid dehydrogenase
MEVLILGGGVVGVTTAYQLLKDGHQVLVIDRLPPGIGGASYGNAGLIATGHSIAWGSPKALKIWFNSLFHRSGFPDEVSGRSAIYSLGLEIAVSMY